MEYMEYEDAAFGTLKDKVLSAVKNNGDEVLFETADGGRFKLYHEQGCCEHVYVEDICGSLEDVIGSPILMADEESSRETPVDVRQSYAPESQTWTFYKLATVKGSVTIRFHGTSNGYYGERVNFAKMVRHAD